MIIKTNNTKKPRIIITPGEPAGIGPDIIIMIAQKKWPMELVICADANLLLNRAQILNLPLKLRSYCPNKPAEPCLPGELSILHISLNKTVITGQLNTANNNYVINTLKRATQGCINGEFLALITGPVNKAILNKGGTLFLGHTEFLSQYSQCKKTVMILNHNKFRVALATTHIPIQSVSQAITRNSLYETIIILNKGLKEYFGILRPKIYVCGLNPHSGESGYIGTEEIDIIIPTLNLFKKYEEYNIIGPLAADTIFQKKYRQDADAFLTMYHDQGLPVLKYSGFGKSVNITFGLPFIRTSVDHGTALELSGTGKAKPSSMATAIIITINIIKNFYEKNLLQESSYSK